MGVCSRAARNGFASRYARLVGKSGPSPDWFSSSSLNDKIRPTTVRSNQFPASFVKLNACRQTNDIFANEPVVNHLPSCFTLRPHGLVSEKAAVWWYEHPHVYEW